MVVILLMIAGLIGVSIGAGSQGDIKFESDTMSAWIAALATVCIAILTMFLAFETSALRKLQLDQVQQLQKDARKPNVVIYIESAPVTMQFMNVRILNNGSGMARNIKFNFDNKLDDNDVFSFVEEKASSLVMIRDGIAALGVGESRVSFLFSFLDLRKKFEGKIFDYFAEVSIEYEDILGEKYTDKTYINFAEFEGVHEFGGDPLFRLADAVEKIEKGIKK